MSRFVGLSWQVGYCGVRTTADGLPCHRRAFRRRSLPQTHGGRSRSTAVDRGEGNEGGPGFRKVLESPGETPVSSEPGQRGFERSVPQVTSTVRARRTRSTAKCAAISQVGMCVTSHSFLDCSVPGTRCPVDNDCRRANRASQVNGVRDGQRRRKSTEAVLAPRRESALAGLHW